MLLIIVYVCEVNAARHAFKAGVSILIDHFMVFERKLKSFVEALNSINDRYDCNNLIQYAVIFLLQTL